MYLDAPHTFMRLTDSTSLDHFANFSVLNTCLEWRSMEQGYFLSSVDKIFIVSYQLKSVAECDLARKFWSEWMCRNNRFFCQKAKMLYFEFRLVIGSY